MADKASGNQPRVREKKIRIDGPHTAIFANHTIKMSNVERKMLDLSMSTNGVKSLPDIQARLQKLDETIESELKACMSVMNKALKGKRGNGKNSKQKSPNSASTTSAASLKPANKTAPKAKAPAKKAAAKKAAPKKATAAKATTKKAATTKTAADELVPTI